METKEHRMLPFKVTSYIRTLSEKEPAIKRQFYPSSEENVVDWGYEDPVDEELFMPEKGLVHKYPSRALILFTSTCAAYCRFCTRRRRLSSDDLTIGDIAKIGDYIRKQEITEIIFSGGDPLAANRDVFEAALDTLGRIERVSTIRIGTRLPVADPTRINDDLIRLLEKRAPIYIGINYEHPAEITKKNRHAIQRLVSAGCILYSQTVFLKGVNDDFETLYNLFSNLVQIGVRPLYIYQCDEVKGAQHFKVDLEKEIEIMTELRKVLSGLACPTFVIDVAKGIGKIPVPLGFWKFTQDSVLDFKKKKIELNT